MDSGQVIEILALPLGDGDKLGGEAVARLESLGEEIVPHLIEALGDEALRKQAEAALAHFPLWSIEPLVCGLEEPFCQRFEQEGECRSGCAKLSQPLILIGEEANAAGNEEVLTLLAAAVPRIHRSFQGQGCGSARFRIHDVMPAIGLCAVSHFKEIWPKYPWDLLVEIRDEGPPGDPEKLRRLYDAEQMMDNTYQDLVSRVSAALGQEAVPTLLSLFDVSKVGAREAASKALISIGTFEAIDGMVNFLEANQDPMCTHDVESPLTSRKSMAKVDPLLARSLGKRPSAKRIWVVAYGLRYVREGWSETRAALGEVRDLCGDAVYSDIGTEKPLHELIDKLADLEQ